MNEGAIVHECIIVYSKKEEFTPSIIADPFLQEKQEAKTIWQS